MPVTRRTLMASVAGLTTGAGLLPFASQAAPEGGTLRAAMTGFTLINTLDPGKAAANPEFFVIWGMFNTLVKFDADMRIVGDLAQSWSNPDPTTWEFKLRPGVKFHDGSDLTAEDVAFTFQRIADEGFASPVRRKMAIVTSGAAVDPLLVRFTTAAPFAPLLTYLTNTRSSTQIVCKKAVQAMGNEQYARAPVGSGPWKLTEWRPNEKLTFAAHSQYFEPGLPKAAALDVLLIRDDSSAINALAAGGLEFVNAVPYGDTERVKRLPNVTFLSRPGMNARFVHLNIQRISAARCRCRWTAAPSCRRWCSARRCRPRAISRPRSPGPTTSSRALTPSTIPRRRRRSWRSRSTGRARRRWCTASPTPGGSACPRCSWTW